MPAPLSQSARPQGRALPCESPRAHQVGGTWWAPERPSTPGLVPKDCGDPLDFVPLSLAWTLQLSEAGGRRVKRGMGRQRGNDSGRRSGTAVYRSSPWRPAVAALMAHGTTALCAAPLGVAMLGCAADATFGTAASGLDQRSVTVAEIALAVATLDGETGAPFGAAWELSGGALTMSLEDQLDGRLAARIELGALAGALVGASTFEDGVHRLGDHALLAAATTSALAADPNLCSEDLIGNEPSAGVSITLRDADGRTVSGLADAQTATVLVEIGMPAVRITALGLRSTSPSAAVGLPDDTCIEAGLLQGERVPPLIITLRAELTTALEGNVDSPPDQGEAAPDRDGDLTADAADCAPDDPDIHPGADERCGDGVDNNCAGGVDEGCEQGPPPPASSDRDGDGSPDDQDCAPADAQVHPLAAEECGDGVDNDCSGAADDGCAPPEPGLAMCLGHGDRTESHQAVTVGYGEDCGDSGSRAGAEVWRCVCAPHAGRQEVASQVCRPSGGWSGGGAMIWQILHYGPTDCGDCAGVHGGAQPGCF